MPSFGTSLQGCFPARIGAGAAHYKTLSNPLFRTVEPAHRSWDANGDSVHKVGIPSPPKKTGLWVKMQAAIGLHRLFYKG